MAQDNDPVGSRRPVSLAETAAGLRPPSSAPAVVIVFGLERRPIVYRDVLSEGQERRLDDWLDAHPGYRELVDRALELAREAGAA